MHIAVGGTFTQGVLRGSTGRDMLRGSEGLLTVPKNHQEHRDELDEA
jgi:hypothetical protein